jgi:protein-disulfide isomerase
MTSNTCLLCKKNFKTAEALAMHNKSKHSTIISQRNNFYPKIALGTIIIIIILALGFSLFGTQKPIEKKESLSPFVIKSDDWVVGNPNSSVILIEYLDFECEICSKYYPLVKQIKQEYNANIQVVVRYYPLPGHPNSMTAARLAEAAGQQEQFWQMHDLLFDTQELWGESKKSNEYFFDLASQIDVDIPQLKKDFESQKVIDRVNRNKIEGTKIGVSGTPSFFLNGKKLRNPSSIAEFKTLIDAAILQNPLKQNDSDLIHEHADFKVVLNGTAIDFNQSKYQSTEDVEYHPYTHMHSGIGYILHKHKMGITVKEFLESVNITFNSSCIALDTKESYCDNNLSSLKFLVNNTSLTDFESYELKDLDSILISYGPIDDATLPAQLSSVTDLACMFSELCPQRGTPPTEECVGGLGSECH